MSARSVLHPGMPRNPTGGYVIVLFVVILAFVGIMVSMQVLILTSVATTSRAFDSFRQSTTEAKRLEHAVAEAVLDARQISVAPAAPIADAVQVRVRSLSATGAAPDVTALPSDLPAITVFPNPACAADPLVPVPVGFIRQLTPELSTLIGPRIAVYPPVDFEFSSPRAVLDIRRTYRTKVTATLLAVPLTTFPIVAYELPTDIANPTGAAAGGPLSTLPAGLVPSRDPAFISDMQFQPNVLPYHYRRRASVAAAYQYIFSQPFLNRVAEYAGVTHYHDFDAVSGTAVLAGMTKAGAIASWDIGKAGAGTYNTITATNDAVVVLAATPGKRLQLIDSMGVSTAPPLFLLLLGPTDLAAGPLELELSSIARPLVIVGCNIRVSASAGTALNGALFLDPASSITVAAPLTVGHLSYWAGTTRVAPNAVVAGVLPITAEALAPRVVYVATTSTPL